MKSGGKFFYRMEKLNNEKYQKISLYPHIVTLCPVLSPEYSNL